MLVIHHMHSCLIEAPPSRVRPFLDALWSGRPGDAFPYECIRPWRHVPSRGAGFTLGTQFGHGPFRFVVDRCDNEGIFARVETAGYSGHHGFDLVEEAGGTRVVHTLNAAATLPNWLTWHCLVAASHDWAVQSCLTRLTGLVQQGNAEALAIAPVPWQLRTFADLHNATRRLSLGSAA